MPTVPELQAMAKELGLTGYSKLRKAELEKAIGDKVTENSERYGRSGLASHKVTAPMPNWKRDLIYLAQTRGKRRTPAQSRRMRKHDNRAKGRA